MMSSMAKEEPLPGVNPCPFCLKSRPHYMSFPEEEVIAKSGRMFWVACRACKASGPLRTTHEAAVKAWNHGIPDA